MSDDTAARPAMQARRHNRACARRLMALVLLTVSANAMAADDPSPNDFAYSMKVLDAGEAAAYRITLPVAVYQKAVSEYLADVRIFNAHGEVVPYAIERPSTEVTGAPQPARALPVFPLQDNSGAALDAVRVTIESGRAAVNLQAQAPAAATSLAAIPKNVSVRTASLGPPAVRGGDTRLVPPPRAVPWKTGVLWTVLIVGVGLLGWMAFRLSKDLGQKAA